MKIWISKNSEVPIHDQLVAQITLGIASSDLAVGERLPSTRELARRFRIHQNTVSAAYRELAMKGLVKFKKGSGVYIAEADNALKPTLDVLLAKFLREAAEQGHSHDEIREAMRKSLSKKQTKKILLVESDSALREILIEEIRSATGVQIEGIPLEKLSANQIKTGTQLAAMADERQKIERVLRNANGLFLNTNSVAASMSGQVRPSEGDLIAIVSGWEKFISFAKLYLIAANVDPRTVIERSTIARGWRKGLDQATMIICDSLTAKKLGEDRRLRIFPLVAQSSLKELTKN